MGLQSRIVTVGVLSYRSPILVIITRAPAIVIIMTDECAIVIVKFWSVVPAIAIAFFESLACPFVWIHDGLRLCVDAHNPAPTARRCQCPAGIRPCDITPHPSHRPNMPGSPHILGMAFEQDRSVSIFSYVTKKKKKKKTCNIFLETESAIHIQNMGRCGTVAAISRTRGTASYECAVIGMDDRMPGIWAGSSTRVPSCHSVNGSHGLARARGSR
jgi:hypothetical protein